MLYSFNKIVLVGLLAIITTSVANDSNIELVSSEIKNISVEKSCTNEHEQNQFFKNLLRTPGIIKLRKVTQNYAVLFVALGVVFIGWEIMMEWSKDRCLTHIERQLLWHEVILSYFIAKHLVCNYIEDENSQERTKCASSSPCQS